LHGKKPKRIVGVVQKIGGMGKMAFNSYDELWNILSPRRSDVKRKVGVVERYFGNIEKMEV
jgi:predicted transcriptional regulator